MSGSVRKWTNKCDAGLGNRTCVWVDVWPDLEQTIWCALLRPCRPNYWSWPCFCSPCHRCACHPWTCPCHRPPYPPPDHRPLPETEIKSSIEGLKVGGSGRVQHLQPAPPHHRLHLHLLHQHAHLRALHVQALQHPAQLCLSQVGGHYQNSLPKSAWLINWMKGVDKFHRFGIII